MSIFRSVELPCPACQTPVEFELVHSVSADRRPDLRDAILDGTSSARPARRANDVSRRPEFTYMDIGRGQYIGVWPVSRRGEWRNCADKTHEVLRADPRQRATAEAQSLGKKLAPRVVFGWPALSEKILAREAGIDDRTLEVAKMAMLRRRDDVPLPGEQESASSASSTATRCSAGCTPKASGPGSRAHAADTDRRDRAERDQWERRATRWPKAWLVDFQREMLAAA